jgi:hypothetical protein
VHFFAKTTIESPEAAKIFFDPIMTCDFRSYLHAKYFDSLHGKVYTILRVRRSW